MVIDQDGVLCLAHLHLQVNGVSCVGPYLQLQEAAFPCFDGEIRIFVDTGFPTVMGFSQSVGS